MPAFTVEKSIVIAAPPRAVFSLVRDFRKWRAWSPWLIADPDAKEVFSENPDGCCWEGKVVGSGSVELVAENPEKSMDCRLVFLKPWKSEGVSRFAFRGVDGGTEVTWQVEGTLPFFLFFLKPMMLGKVGMDCERGLKMLCDLAEKGAVPSVLEFPGETGFHGCRYVGIRRTCHIHEIGSFIAADMKTLGEWLAESGIEPVGRPFAVYENWKMGKGETDYVVGFPVVEVPNELPGVLVGGKLPGCPVYQVRHIGAYRHLGNAWAAGMMRAQAKVFAQSRHVAPFEIYESDPGSGMEERNLITTVCFPERREG